MSSALNMIQARREAVRAELAEHRSAIERLTTEDADLDTAEKVFLRLGGEAKSEAPAPKGDLAVFVSHSEADAPAASEAVEEVAERLKGGKRPEGIRPLPDMINDILAEAQAKGLRGMEPKDVRAEIAKRWWPDVKDSSVGSVAWRMWKNDKLAKDGALYFIPNEETPAVSPAGASEQGSGSTDLFKQPAP